ncbi:MAG: fructosamine kinase family protein [Reichenbachiella sp.]|uniref:fructosamine kinase family protein n=1 Tax=Reichenbachiella sp. TaxID=2184521 RepID=UPI0032672DE7
MNSLTEVIHQLLDGSRSTSPSLIPVSGGCIHQAGRFEFLGKKYFIKWNRNATDMFAAEAKGLNTLAATRTIAIPTVFQLGELEDVDYLCMEYVESGVADYDFWQSFGQRLADLHQCTADNFGLDHDNYIGSLSQSNKKHKHWNDFFILERLTPQIKRAFDQNLLSKRTADKFDQLFLRLKDLIPKESPSLIHGDLWSGNFLIGKDQRAFIFDPAVYYGHREAELAFSQMFGGFGKQFYRAYQDTFPLQPGHESRTDIFNLYPLLVHANLFGSSYLSAIERTLTHFT